MVSTFLTKMKLMFDIVKAESHGRRAEILKTFKSKTNS